MRPQLRVWAACLLYVLAGVTVFQSIAQPSTCTALVTQALQAVGQNCQGLGRNAACYGFDRVDARFASEVDETFFSQPADTTPLAELVDIQTTALDLEQSRWGIAVLNVQANVPNTLPGQAVTFLLMGDTQVQNNVTADEALTVGEPVRVVVTAGQRVNLRGGPATTFNIVGNADPGQPFDADALSSDGQWVRLAAFNAWLSRSLVAPLTAGESLDSLPVTDSDAPSPMQAFYFRTGIGAPTCEEAPDVLVLQGPTEVRVRLSINGAEVELGSTAVLRSAQEPFSNLSGSPVFGGLVSGFDPVGDPACLATELALVEGDALVNGESALHIPLGHASRTVTCLNEDSVPVFTSPWGAPEVLTEEDLNALGYVEALPLPRPVTLPSVEEIADSVARGPNVKPEPTLLPLIARPTRVVSTPDPSRPTVTTAPQNPNGPTVTPEPVSSGPSCDGFRATSPFGPVGNVVQFFWDPARNIYGYQLEVTALDDGEAMEGGTRLYRVGSTETSYTVDLRREQVYGNGIRWRLQVLVTDANNNITTLCETGYTENPVQD